MKYAIGTLHACTSRVNGQIANSTNAGPVRGEAKVYAQIAATPLGQVPPENVASDLDDVLARLR